MKKLFSIFVLAAAALSATPATTQLTFVNAGSPVVSDGSYDVGPYTVAINGQNYAALCVDFLHQSSTNTTWTAYVNTISDYSKLYHPDNLMGYMEEAYLYNQIILPGADRTDIQHAAWSITDSNYKADSAAQNFVQKAQANFMNVNFAGFEVLSATSGNQQEFLIWNPSCATAPEPGSFAMLGGGLLFGIGLIRRNRKKKLAA
jgi:hypothetical protein